MVVANNGIEITIRWGIAIPSISIQLDEIGIRLKHDKERFYDSIKDSINKLALSLIFTDSQIETLYKRANKALSKDIQLAVNTMSNDDYYRMLRLLEKKAKKEKEND